MCSCIYVYLSVYTKDRCVKVQKMFLCLQSHMSQKGEGVGKRRKRPRPFLEIDLGKVKMLSVFLSDSKSHQNFTAENFFENALWNF